MADRVSYRVLIGRMERPAQEDAYMAAKAPTSNRHSKVIFDHFLSTAVGREGRNLMTSDMIRCFIDSMILDHLLHQDDSVSWETMRPQIETIRREVYEMAGVPDCDK
jgi:hypothetical protein